MSIKFHESTNFGIEIEICIKKDFYQSLQDSAPYDLYTTFISTLKGKTLLERMLENFSG